MKVNKISCMCTKLYDILHFALNVMSNVVKLYDITTMLRQCALRKPKNFTTLRHTL